MTAVKVDVNFFLNQARVKLIGASDAAIKAEFFDVLKEFFTDSNVWSENIDVNIEPDTTVYNIATGTGQTIRLEGVLDPNQIPQPAIMPEIDTLIFRDLYNSSATFTATVIKSVTQPTDKNMIPEFPDWVLPIWGVGIMDGLLGKMMAQSNKSYSDQKMSLYHLARFRSAIARAKASATRRNTMGAQAWRFPSAFSTRTQRGGVSTSNPTRFT